MTLSALKLLLFTGLVELLCLDVASGDQGFYVIVAPKAFRPGSIYNITATCYSTTNTVDVTATIQGSDLSILTKEAELLNNGVSKILSLQIPDTVPATVSYTLVVEGKGGNFNFTDNHAVEVKRKTLSLFIQTDKSMYKPGQTVLFRAILLYPDLKPYQGLADISIYDVVGNKIMQWLKQKNNTGVITNSLMISDQPPLGEWKIIVTAGENSCTKTFTVAKYVLPKFKVTVTLPSYYLVNLSQRNLQAELPITVTAEYTYGQPVKGRANIIVQLQPYYYETLNYTTIMKDVELINGKADISLTIKDLLALVPTPQYGYYTPDPWNTLSHRSILVVANVSETVTGVVLSGNSTVNCKSQKYALTFLDMTANNYKPGLVYWAFLSLAQADGTAPDPADMMLPGGNYSSVVVEVAMNYPSVYDHTYGYYTYPTKKQIIAMNASAFMSFSILIDGNATGASLSATFNDSIRNNTVYAFKSISRFMTRDQQWIQVTYDGSDGVIRPLQEAIFSVRTTKPIMAFHYTLVSKGSIILSDIVTGEATTVHSFSIWISKDLALKLVPSARIVVTYKTDTGEIIVDSNEVSVADGFANQVSLSFDKNSTSPSQNVSLTVNAFRESYVGILAVDQSVLLLQGGNDITQDMVSGDLRAYDTAKSSYYYGDFMWRPYFIINGADSSDIIDNAGLFVITNGSVFKSRRDPIYLNGPGGAVPPIAFAPNAPGGSIPRADDGGNTVQDSNPRVLFPETWIWSDLVAGPNGTVTLQTSVPDTITSWVASAFALSNVSGLGITKNTSKITVFKPFFLSPNLPYSIIRGEEFGLQATIFNYLSTRLDVTVTLEESNFFKVVNGTSKLAKVESNDAVSVYFWIVAESLGQIPINIKASSPVAGDAVMVMLLVKPEGVQQQYSTSAFIQLSDSAPTYNNSLDITLPPVGQLVPGSEFIEVAVIGDIMGPSVKGLDNLLKMPFGCGEQNMLNFAPDVYITDYLSISNQLTSDLLSKSLNFMNMGYQRELTYQRSDGSFSAFGDSDRSGSIWLSSFVIKCFHQASDYIPIDDRYIAKTMQWIIANQAGNGSFAEPPFGGVIHVDMQGGSSKGLPLTAYVLNALLENHNNSLISSVILNHSIVSAQIYLEQHVSSVISDPYALSIMAYALARANSSTVSYVLQKLENIAIVKGGTKYWEKASDGDDGNIQSMMWRPHYSQARSVNIEMTAYILLTYCHLNNLSMSLPIAKWIIAQRNAEGGFSSTQDTVVALEALAAFASMIAGPSRDRRFQVSIATESVQHNFLPITSETAILLQSFQLPSNSSRVSVFASGIGSAVVQLNVKYNVYKTEDSSAISMIVHTTGNDNVISVWSCSRWTKNTGSGMVVMEFNHLTGYQVSNVDQLMTQVKGLKRVDNTNDGVVLYFDELTSDETCVNITSNKVYPVNNIQDAAIKVYPYYDPSISRTSFFAAQTSSSTICDTCPQCCNLGHVALTPEKPVHPDTSTALTSQKFCLKTLCVMLLFSCFIFLY